VDTGEKISGKFVVACGDCAKVFEFVEEALDEVAFSVKREVSLSWREPVRFGRNDRRDSTLLEGGDQGVGVIGLVGEKGFRVDLVEERFSLTEVGGLARRERNRNRVAERVGDRMDFGRQSAAGSSDRLPAVFFRAPALCW
jgi:hypothetical protein